MGTVYTGDLIYSYLQLLLYTTLSLYFENLQVKMLKK